MRIRIKALDTLFFRDGKPFGMEESTWATGIFPPPPSVFYGALRSLYFSLNPDKMGLAGTESDPTIDKENGLKINSINIALEDDYYFPAPADLVMEKDDEDEVHLLNLKKNKANHSGVFQEYLIMPPKNTPIESTQGESYLNKITLIEDYFNGNTPDKPKKTDSLITKEPKIGIGRNNLTGVSDDGKLYRVEMLRFSDGESNAQLNFTISFDFENIDLKEGDTGFIKLGGEGKGASYEILSNDTLFALPDIETYFKIYLNTPAFFSNSNLDGENSTKRHGWLPSFVDENMEGVFHGVHVKLIGACIGKYQNIGGFDMKKKSPKLMKKAVPAGSVYFLKKMDTKPFHADLKQGFCLSNFRKDEGFGNAFLAKIDKQIKSL
jgi:CRISPR-associated protein Cmr3